MSRATGEGKLCEIEIHYHRKINSKFDFTYSILARVLDNKSRITF